MSARGDLNRGHPPLTPEQYQLRQEKRVRAVARVKQSNLYKDAVARHRHSRPPTPDPRQGAGECPKRAFDYQMTAWQLKLRRLLEEDKRLDLENELAAAEFETAWHYAFSGI